VESPDNGQPGLPHAGSCNAVPLMSWPSAMKVSAAVGEAVTPAGADAVMGDGAAALVVCPAGVASVAAGADVAVALAVLDADDPAELAVELHAVTSKAAQASAAQPPRAAAGRARCEFVVHMDIQAPSTQLAALRALSSLRRPPCRRGWNPSSPLGGDKSLPGRDGLRVGRTASGHPPVVRLVAGARGRQGKVRAGWSARADRRLRDHRLLSPRRPRHRSRSAIAWPARSGKAHGPGSVGGG